MAEYDSVIPAGGSGTLTTKMKTTSTQNGRVSKSVNIFTDAPGSENLHLRFTVDIHMPITATPSMRLVVNAIEGTSSSQRILLSRSDGKPLVVRRTKLPLEEISVTAHPVAAAADPTVAEVEETPTPWGAPPVAKKTPAGEAGDVWLEMETATSLAAGRYSDVVRVATNDPEAPEIQIPFTVRVRPLIEARPAVVRMWTAPTTRDPGRSSIVTLVHHGDREFGVSSVAVSHPEVFTAAVYGDEIASQQSIRIGLIEGLDSAALGASLEGWIRITTDDPERPLMEVPVLVAPTRTLSRRPVNGLR